MDEEESIRKSESEDSDDDDGSNHEEEIAEIEFCRKQVLQNGTYDDYVALINALRKAGELEDLRKVREDMNKIYPLSPVLWMEWLTDEQKVCTNTAERDFISDIFKRAVNDYMSVQIWVEYIMFTLGGGKMEETRKICEEALTAVGVHLAEGILVWQAVLLVEQQYFESLSQENSKLIEEQKKRLQSLYRRQARVPLMNLNKQEFLSEAKKYFEDVVDSQVKRDLDNSLKKVIEKLPYEEALLRATDETEKLEAYRKYIDFVRVSDNPAVIQNLYERTIADLCLNEGIWEEYVRFVFEQFSSAHYVILPVCERSQRNCQWSSALFELHITALEKFDEDIGVEEVDTRINAALEKTLSCRVLNEVDLIKIWISYLVYLRRKIKWNDNNYEPQLMEFRTGCEKGMASIDERLGDDGEGDKECTIARFQAKVEAESAKEMEVARSLWNDVVMKRNNNFKKANFWLEFINLERSYGSHKHCRKLYRRALERVWDDVEVIGSSFLQFEQELGTLENMLDFEKRYRDRMSVVQKRRLEDAMKEEAKKEQNKTKFKQNKENKMQKDSSMKQKHIQSPEALTSQFQHSPKGKKRKASESEEVLDAPPGYEKYEANKKQKVNENHGEFVEHDSSADHRTVFLSNMDYNAEQEEILSIFVDCGEVDSFRTAKDYKGRSKGFGYLVFVDGASVSKALTKDRTPVNGRPLFISRCDPQNRDHAFKFATGLEKEKLFIRGLPISMNEDEVKKLFESHGEVKSIRLVTHRNGHSKGICYLEYPDAETAEKVRQKMDGITVADHKITVLISNPSAKKNPEMKPRNIRAALGGPSIVRQRPKLSLVPRALLRNSLSESKNHENGATSNGKEQNGNVVTREKEESTSKTNEDFRKLFFK